MYNTLHRKLNTEQHEPHKNWVWSQVLRNGDQIVTIKKYRPNVMLIDLLDVSLTQYSPIFMGVYFGIWKTFSHKLQFPVHLNHLNEISL